jgi:hypothetical protein
MEIVRPAARGRVGGKSPLVLEQKGAMTKFAVLLVLVAAIIPAAASAAKPQFTERMSVKPTGCPPAFAGGVVTLVDCVGRAPFAGTGVGTVDLRYTAKANLATNKGSQQGTLTFHGKRGGDALVLSFKGTVTVTTGSTTGTWIAAKQSGAFAKLAPRSGTYTSHSGDDGVTVSFVVLG